MFFCEKPRPTDSPRDFLGGSHVPKKLAREGFFGQEKVQSIYCSLVGSLYKICIWFTTILGNVFYTKTRKRTQAIQRLRGSPCLVPFVTVEETKGEKTLEEIPVVYLSLPSFLRERRTVPFLSQSEWVGGRIIVTSPNGERKKRKEGKRS